MLYLLGSRAWVTVWFYCSSWCNRLLNKQKWNEKETTAKNWLECQVLMQRTSAGELSDTNFYCFSIVCMPRNSAAYLLKICIDRKCFSRKSWSTCRYDNTSPSWGIHHNGGDTQRATVTSACVNNTGKSWLSLMFPYCVGHFTDLDSLTRGSV